jgi:hypothetical protein
VRALTLRQPWAWMVVHGGKRIENRRWQPWEKLGGGKRRPWRGEFLIHAGLTCTEEEYRHALDFAFGVPGRDWAIGGSELGERYIPALDELPVGAYVGRARLTGVLPKPTQELGWEHDWRIPGQLGWVVEDVVAFEQPVYAPGARGLWTVPEHDLAKLRRLGLLAA